MSNFINMKINLVNKFHYTRGFVKQQIFFDMSFTLLIFMPFYYAYAVRS